MMDNSDQRGEMTACLVARMTGGDAVVANLCRRLVEEEFNRGSVCIQVTPEERARLTASPAVASGLFVLAGNRLYTRRNHRYEQAVRTWMDERAALPPEEAPTVPETGVYATLNTEQREAVRQMCSRSFSILTGGPGTGKTYTIARAVSLARQGKPDLRLGRAAPTGKAAARVREAMRQEAAAMGIAAEELHATTIHSLLGASHDGVNFHHHHDNPLALDWLVVDEASMIDLPLMAKLLDAVPSHCRLTLVGDADQLASVEAGHVFGDLSRIPGVPLTRLVDSRRFPQGGAIQRLAAAVNDGSAEHALAILRENAPQIHYTALGQEKSPGRWPGFRTLIETHFRGFALAETHQEALKVLDNCRILCAFRSGPYGVNALNAYVQSIAAHLGEGKGCPVPWMITRNDRGLGVSNGDVGVVMPQDPERLWLPSDTPGAEPWAVPLALLPDRELAFATTVHKSQGSEFCTVVIVLPPNPPEGDGATLLTREILYTAITRTRRDIFLFAGDATIASCASRGIERCTGLADRQGACLA